ncbi:unnamed protein product [Fraxinus pennsylvanica]|uniref:Uncharacterized protein n=1 Tax=Fraxinus pennsylvanica TaxID=56036 RepID=A0AAD1ZK76_9LAMI|nr:unnamed protein product [Fraxinus pennsylvanica]
MEKKFFLEEDDMLEDTDDENEDYTPLNEDMKLRKIMMILAGDEFSFGNKRGLNGTDREGPVLSKLGSTSELRPKPDAKPKTTAMPPTSVMTRLILIMVWRKLIRNPNTYSSLIRLTWSLVSFKWHGEMPAIIAKSIAILSDAGLGMAMFSLGY